MREVRFWPLPGARALRFGCATKLSVGSAPSSTLRRVHYGFSRPSDRLPADIS